MRWRSLKVILAMVMSAAVATAAVAYFTSTGSGAGAATASTQPTPGTPVATATPGNTTVGLAWSAVTGPNGATLTGYYVQRFVGGVFNANVCGTTPNGPLVTAANCSDTSVPDGTYTYKVTAVYRTWTATSAPSNSVTVTGDVTGPTLAITFPAASGLYNATSWNAGCTSRICGTATDASGVNNAKVSIRQGTGNYWNGSAFASASEVLLSATGTTSWTQSFPASNFSANGTYTVRAVATDNLSNTSTVSNTFTYDNTGPVNVIAITSAVQAFLNGTTLYFGASGGSFKFVDAPTDTPAGPASATFPAINTVGWAHGAETVSSPSGGPYTSTVFSFGSNTPSGYSITGTDAAGNTTSTPITFIRDIVAPANGTLTYTNGYVNTLSVPVTAPNATDGLSGVNASSAFLQRRAAVLTAGTCGSFGAFTTVGAPAPNTVFNDTTVTSGNCYQYQYFVSDNVGNQSAAYTSASVAKVDSVAPVPTNVVLNGGSGGAGQGDQVVVTYSEALQVASFCSTWSPDGSNQSIIANNVVTVTITDNGANDYLTVSTTAAACGGNFHFGTVNLGGNYVSLTRTFNGNGSNASQITWTAATNVLTIQLGTASGGVNTNVPLGTPTYAPDINIKDLAGNAINGSLFTAPATSRF